MPLVAATRAKQDPNLLSQSRMRYFGACPKGVASLSCCAVQASVGNRVTPTWITRARVQFDDEENKQRTEEKVSNWQKVAGPDLLSMAVKERPPHLTSCPCRAHRPHVLLNSAFRNVNAQLEQFAPDAFCSPQSVVPCHLLDQGNSLCRKPSVLLRFN